MLMSFFQSYPIRWAPFTYWSCDTNPLAQMSILCLKYVSSFISSQHLQALVHLSCHYIAGNSQQLYHKHLLQSVNGFLVPSRNLFNNLTFTALSILFSSVVYHFIIYDRLHFLEYVLLEVVFLWISWPKLLSRNMPHHFEFFANTIENGYWKKLIGWK